MTFSNDNNNNDDVSGGGGGAFVDGQAAAVTQGQDLIDFYGAATAKFYAEIMSDEMKKVIPDLQFLLQQLPPFPSSVTTGTTTTTTILDTCVGSGRTVCCTGFASNDRLVVSSKESICQKK